MEAKKICHRLRDSTFWPPFATVIKLNGPKAHFLFISVHLLRILISKRLRETRGGRIHATSMRLKATGSGMAALPAHTRQHHLPPVDAAGRVTGYVPFVGRI